MIAVKSKYRILFAFIILLIQSCGAENLQLVINRKPVAALVLPNEPSSVEKKSAAVLQDFVRRITGATLPIVTEPSGNMSHHIFVGNAVKQNYTGKIAQLKAEGYEIFADKGNLFIRGGSGKGLLYGVYELIEKQFGARKYDQGVAVTPHNNTLTISATLHMYYEPVILYRESYYPPSADSEYLDWHHLHRFEDLWGVWGHSVFKIVPPERYFHDHPDYFALNNGRRQPTQLCLSNPQVKGIFIDFFRKVIADHPDALYWSIAPMDAGGYCTCESCARADAEEGGPQGSLIRFVNSIAADFPDQLFTTLAYGYAAEAPKYTKPRKNVYIILSTIGANRQQDLANDPGAAAFRRQLTQWSKITSNLFVWDYTTQFTAYLSPFPMYDHYQANIRFLYQHGVKGILEQGSGEDVSDMYVYASYMQAQLLWDPSVKVSDVEDDFFRGYYGPADAEVKRYINGLITARNETLTRLDIYGNPIEHRKDYLAASRMEQYKQWLKQGLASVNGYPEFIKRIDALNLGLTYVELEQAKTYGTQKLGYLEKTADGNWQVKTGWKDRVEGFVINAQKLGVKELSETGGNLQDYKANWTNLLQRPYRTSLIAGIRPVFSHPFIPDYPANGTLTLTDGILGGTDYSYNWLLFADSLVYITFSVENTIKPSKIQTAFLVDPTHYLFLPDAILVQASADGRQYFNIGERKFTLTEPVSNKPFIYSFELPLTPQSIRYLRLALRVPDKLPDWFQGSRHRKPLVAIDEVSVE